MKRLWQASTWHTCGSRRRDAQRSRRLASRVPAKPPPVLVHRFPGTDHLCGIHVSCHGLYPPPLFADAGEVMTAWGPAIGVSIPDRALAEMVSVTPPRTQPGGP